MSTIENTQPNQRLDVVDALRGFALLGIVFVHFMEQFYAAGPPPPHENYTQHIAADGVFDAFVNILLRGKFFMLFSFLFGLSFSIQMKSRGDGFWPRFLWRLSLLFAIGWVHQCFYRGDILTIYGLVGIPLVLLHRLSNQLFIVIAVVLMFGIPRIITKIAIPESTNFEAMQEQSKPKEIVYWETVKTGSWFDIAKQNSDWGFKDKMVVQFGVQGRGYQTLALFFLGLYAGRVRFFENLEDKKHLLKRGLWWSLGAFLGCIAVAVLLFAGLKLSEKVGKGWDMIVGMTLYDVANLSQMFLYLFSFLLLFMNKPWWQRQILKLAPYGRMALTNYVMQSVIGSFIFFGYGLNQLDQFGSTVATAIALVVFMAQRSASAWWLKRYYFGPLEWLWRSATFFKIQKFKK